MLSELHRLDLPAFIRETNPLPQAERTVKVADIPFAAMSLVLNFGSLWI